MTAYVFGWNNYIQRYKGIHLQFAIYYIILEYLKCIIKQRLEDQFLQSWNSVVQHLPKAIIYKTFKTKFT
jgi:hypothetical protein